MKKFNTLVQQMNILTISQMAQIKGGAALGDSPAPNVGPLDATNDEKRRDRPGGGVSTH